MRSGGDAGAAIHTSVPFGSLLPSAPVLHCGEDIGGRRQLRQREAPGCLPGANQGRYFGGSMLTLIAGLWF